MPVAPQRRKPTYPIASVDNALRLLQMLRDVGEVRVKDAADELHVSPSTVHRLMSMLVYRGFALQDESRVYMPGPAVGLPAARVTGIRELQELVRPRLAELRDAAGESAYFGVLTGRVVRFLLTAESTFPSRAGDRDGFVVPAHASSGGRAILSTMREAELEELYRLSTGNDSHAMSERDFSRLSSDLSSVRAQGYAVGVEQVERGIVTVSAPIRLEWLRPRATVSLSAQITHKRTITDSGSVEKLLDSRDLIEQDIIGH